MGLGAEYCPFKHAWLIKAWLNRPRAESSQFFFIKKTVFENYESRVIYAIYYYHVSQNSVQQHNAASVLQNSTVRYTKEVRLDNTDTSPPSLSLHPRPLPACLCCVPLPAVCRASLTCAEQLSGGGVHGIAELSPAAAGPGAHLEAILGALLQTGDRRARLLREHTARVRLLALRRTERRAENVRREQSAPADHGTEGQGTESGTQRAASGVGR